MGWSWSYSPPRLTWTNGRRVVLQQSEYRHACQDRDSQQLQAEAEPGADRLHAQLNALALLQLLLAGVVETEHQAQ